MYASVSNDNRNYDENEFHRFESPEDPESELVNKLRLEKAQETKTKLVNEYIAENNLVELKDDYFGVGTYYYKSETNEVYHVVNVCSFSPFGVHKEIDVKPEFKIVNDPHIRRFNNLPMGEKELARNKIIDDYIAENNLIELSINNDKSLNYLYDIGTKFYYDGKTDRIYEVSEKSKVSSLGLPEENEPNESINMIFRESYVYNDRIREMNNLPPKSE